MRRLWAAAIVVALTIGSPIGAEAASARVRVTRPPCPKQRFTGSISRTNYRDSHQHVKGSVRATIPS